jgi:hypothetical protein
MPLSLHRAPAIAPLAPPKPLQANFPNEPIFLSQPEQNTTTCAPQNEPAFPPPIPGRTATMPTPSTLRDIAMPAPDRS